ncbi:hypothetical protein RB597_002905 [Gaeumannomyces tritici]
MKVSAVSVLVFGAATLATPTFGFEKDVIDWAKDQLGGKSSQVPAPAPGATEDYSSNAPVATATAKPVTTAPPPPPPPATTAAPVTSPVAPVTSSAAPLTSAVPPPAPDCNVKPGVKMPVGCPDPCSNVKPGHPAPDGCPASAPAVSSAPVEATSSLIVATSSKPLIVDNKPTPAPNGTYKPTTPPVLAGASTIAQGLGVGFAVAALLGFAFAL